MEILKVEAGMPVVQNEQFSVTLSPQAATSIEANPELTAKQITQKRVVSP